MIPRHPLISCLIAITLLVSAHAFAPVSTTSPAAMYAPPARDWDEQLENLHPDRPMEYFELAELVADAADSEPDRALARWLFGRAGVLDKTRLGRSACLALADLETDDVARRRLRALADLLDQDGHLAVLDRTMNLDDEYNIETVLRLGEALSHYRRGAGARTINILRDETVEALFLDFEFLFPGGLDRFREDCARLRGRSRPLISPRLLQQQLLLEEALISGDQRRWSADLVVSNAAPLIDVDPRNLERSLGVDASRPIHRNGRWVPLSIDQN